MKWSIKSLNSNYVNPMLKCLEVNSNHIYCSYEYYTKIPEVNLTAFIYRLFHEDLSSIIRTSTVLANTMPHAVILVSY